MVAQEAIPINYCPQGKLNEKSFEWDVAEIKANKFHVIRNNCSYNVEVLKAAARARQRVYKEL